MDPPFLDVSAVSPGKWEGMSTSEDPSSLVDDANPDFANLLVKLKERIDSSGMSITLAQPLEEAMKVLMIHRVTWLKWTTLHQFLQETVLQPRDALLRQDQIFLETLEMQMLISSVKQIFSRRVMTKPDTYQPPLGLETKHLTKFVPYCQNQNQMKKKLPATINKHLEDSCMALLSYYHPESDYVGAKSRRIMIAGMPEILASDKRHLKVARYQQEELKRSLVTLNTIYPKVLLCCLGHLKRLACEFRLVVQSNMDQVNTQYIEIKINALVLKLWNEEMKVLLETYTPEVLNVHQIIRDKLHSSMSDERMRADGLYDILLKYKSLGPEFEKLVEEYTKLQEKIQRHQWMVTELDKC